MFLDIFIPVIPVAKARPRFRRLRNGSVHTFTPGKTKTAEEQIASCVFKHMAAGKLKPLGGVVVVELVFALPKPKSVKKRLHPTVKADIDNYCKLVFDSLNGIAWEDDAQIIQIVAQKTYATEGPTGITLRVKELLSWEENEKGIAR